MKMACCSYWQDHFGSESISASWHFICSPRTGDVAPRIVAVRSSAKRHCEEAGSGSISDAVLPNFFGCPGREDLNLCPLTGFFSRNLRKSLTSNGSRNLL